MFKAACIVALIALQVTAQVMTGGYQQVNAATFASQNLNYVSQAESAVQTQYNPAAQGLQYQGLVSVQQQVVSGMNYKLTLQYGNANQTVYYQVVIYSCPWEGIDQVTSVQQVAPQTTQSFNKILPRQKLANSAVKKAEQFSNGGWRQVNQTTFNQTNSLVVSEAINAVNTKFNPEASGYYFSNIVQVDQQIVAGINYGVVLQYTNALGQSEYFEVIIYSAPWKGADQVVTVKALDQPTLVSNYQVGGWNSINATTFANANNNIIQDAVVAVNNKFYPTQNGYEFLQVVSVTQQVVAGMNYNIVLQYQNDEGLNQYYDVIIYSTPWNGNAQVVSVKQLSASTLAQ